MHMPIPDRPLVIERPDLQTATQRFGYMSMTFICWGIWMYLLMPLFSLLAWAAGAYTVYDVLIQNLSTADLLEMLAGYGAGILMLTATYLIWAVTSYLRFRDVDRRRAPQPVADPALAASHRITLALLKSMRRVKHLVISAEELDVLFGVEVPDVAKANGTAMTLRRNDSLDEEAA